MNYMYSHTVNSYTTKEVRLSGGEQWHTKQVNQIKEDEESHTQSR